MKKDEEALEVQGLSVHYHTAPVLWDISLTIPQGHMVGIIGPNGAGKTTFVRAVLGLIKRSSGSVRFLNHSLSKVRKRIAYLPQRTQVDWTFPMTVRELVQMGSYPRRGLFRRLTVDDEEAVDRALEVVDLTAVTHCQIGELSGGQQQRAFLARSLVQQADIYFLDEPFAGIDIVSEQVLVRVLHEMQRDGKTMFIVHHDLMTAEAYFDWVILLNMSLIASGPFREAFTLKNLRSTYGHGIALVEDLLRASVQLSRGESSHVV